MRYKEKCQLRPKYKNRKPMLATKLWVSSFIFVEILSQVSYGCKNLSGRMLDLGYKWISNHGSWMCFPRDRYFYSTKHYFCFELIGTKNRNYLEMQCPRMQGSIWTMELHSMMKLGNWKMIKKLDRICFILN